MEFKETEVIQEEEGVDLMGRRKIGLVLLRDVHMVKLQIERGKLFSEGSHARHKLGRDGKQIRSYERRYFEKIQK